MSQAAGFIGRQREIREISAILFRDGCRLLTLQGPGGSGKTSLAEEVARQTATHFQDGAEVVYLQSIRTPDFLASTIADAIQAPLGGQEAPAVQLLRFLQPRHLLLVLDNFEHLMVGVDLLSEILTQAPGVKLLVTSREILNLRDEWLYPVGGMAIPPEDSDDAESFDSVQLFAWYARRMRHNFALSAEIDAVARIARALQGMPLALELASSWIKTLTCAQIADEIQHNTDLLQSNLRDFPERHRSMRAVFNQSWQQLTEQEQQVFQRLSIFSGSFQLDAAQAITDASLPTLSSLVDKSLLRREADGRYQVHEQLRQYAQEKLEESPEESQRIHDAHSTYYAAFLSRLENDIKGGGQQAAVETITPEIENVRRAWRWAARTTHAANLNQAMYTLANFYDFRGRYIDAMQLFEEAERCLEVADPTSAQLQAQASVWVWLSWFHLRIGQFDEAKSIAQQAIDTYEQHDMAHPPGLGTDPLNILGTLAVYYGDFDEGRRLAAQVVERAQAARDPHNQAMALQVMGNAALQQGDYQRAYDHAYEAYTLSKSLEDDWYTGYILYLLGNVSQKLGNTSIAIAYYHESSRIRAQFDNLKARALGLHQLGEAMMLQEDYAQAAHYFSETVAICRQINDLTGLAGNLGLLGVAWFQAQEYMQAAEAYSEALQTSLDVDLITFALADLNRIARLLIVLEEPEQAVEILAFIHNYPASPKHIRESATQELQNLEQMLSAGDFQAASSKTNSLTNVTANARAWLAQLYVQHPASSTATASQVSTIEALSERELEVLRLLADGLSNQEIAEELVVAVGTVKAHNHNIFNKLGATNRVQAITRARELGLL